MTKDEALKLALDALEIEEAQTHYPSQWVLKAISAIKKALVPPEHEPVMEYPDYVAGIGWRNIDPIKTLPVAWYVERQHIGFRDHGLKIGPFWKLSKAEEWTDTDHILKELYTVPLQRTWVGMTKEEMETTHWSPDFQAGAKWANAKLKQKNT